MDTEHASHRDTASMDSETEDPLSPTTQSVEQERGRSRVRQSRRRGRGSLGERGGERGRESARVEGGSVGRRRGRARGRGRGEVGIRRGGRVRVRGRGSYRRSNSVHSPSSSPGKTQKLK